MIKLGHVINIKIKAQVEEAATLGMKDLSEELNVALEDVVGADMDDSITKKDIMQQIKVNLWKSALSIIGYHDLKSVDIKKMAQIIDDMSQKVFEEVESDLNVSGELGPKDNLPGV